MNAWAITDKGVVRKQNQDTFFACCDDEKKIALLVVCDGMGGAAAGDVASRLALNAFTDEVKKRLTGDPADLDYVRIVEEALMIANRIVFDASLGNREYRGMGTTLVAAIVTESGATVANVGDSRAYHVTRYGISQITRDHSIVEDMVQRGDITRDEARTHPNKNLITRALGTAEDVFPDVFTLELLEDEYLFLCSDGLSNQVSDQEILYEIRRGETESAACEKLLEIAMLRGGPDNITFVLFKK